jgi:UDP-N-acetylglucosamine--N-acetylmuramyl-(pentapeptide) pyrophosphoryl-undecaprenol N-acetylglucosamine transferase
MQKVPQAGYEIIGLRISGIQRRITTKNLLIPFHLIGALIKARKVIAKFKPDVVIGVGGYASGPLLYMAGLMGIPTLIQEQNSYAGITNKLLAKNAKKICVAYTGMDRFFPKEKIIITGNPVRQDLTLKLNQKEDSLSHFRLKPEKITLLVVGGSLGARTINQAIHSGAEKLERAGIQVLWQTGKGYFPIAQAFLKEANLDNIFAHEFIYEMDFAYAAADIVVSRAGAMSISELCMVGKPAILVPSPNVAEDHQTANAKALTAANAALMITDADAPNQLVDAIIALSKDEVLKVNLADNIRLLAKPAATSTIVNEVLALIKA